nr:MFS transporter [uncultured Ligilactobacillus sp.]
MYSKNKTVLAVIAGSCLGFIGILIGTSLIVTFPTLIKQFNLPLYIIQWLSSGYYLCATIIMSTTSVVMRSFSLKKIFILSSCLFLIGMITSFLASNFIILLIGCLINAIATGLATPLMYQIVFSTVNQADYGKYDGIVTMIKSFGPAFGPTYGGILTSLFSWKLIFLGTIPLLVIAFIIGMYALPHQNDSNRQSFLSTFNFKGLILFGGMLVSFSIFVNQLGTLNLKNLVFMSVMLLGLGILFIHNNQHTSKKYLNFNVLKNKIVKKRAFNFFSLQFINLSIAFLLPIYCEELLHLTPFLAGLLTLPGALVGALISPLTGKFYDKYGAFKTFLFSNTFIVISLILFLLLYPHLSIELVVLIYVIFRVGYSMGFGNLMADAGKYVTKNNRSTLSALFNTFQQYSGSIGNTLMATFISILSTWKFSGNEALKLGGKMGFALLTLIAVVMLLFTTMEKKQQNEKDI